MLDMGFEKQVRSILNSIRPDRQTLMFSATFRKRVEGLARDAVRNTVRITVGLVGQSNENINQQVCVRVCLCACLHAVSCVCDRR